MAKNQPTPAAENETAAAPTTETKPTVEPTSPKLTELQTQLAEAKKAVNASFSQTGDIEAPETVAANLEMVRIKTLIKAEIAAIKSDEAKAIEAEARNKRTLMAEQPLITSGVQKPYNEATTAALELVVNELLSKFSKPRSAGTGNSNASKTTGNKAEATAMHVTNKASGMDDASSRKAIEAAGIPRSTAWHAVNDYNKANA